MIDYPVQFFKILRTGGSRTEQHSMRHNMECFCVLSNFLGDLAWKGSIKPFIVGQLTGEKMKLPEHFTKTLHNQGKRFDVRCV